MRFFLSLIMAITALHCNSRITPASTNMADDSSVTLLDASYQNNIPGYNSPRSSDYYFTLVIHTGNRLQFDSAWIDDKAYPVFLSRQSSIISNAPVSVAKGDTVIARVSFVHTNTQTNAAAPISYEGKALLRYHENETPKYIIVKDIKTITGPNRQ